MNGLVSQIGKFSVHGWCDLLGAQQGNPCNRHMEAHR